MVCRAAFVGQILILLSIGKVACKCLCSEIGALRAYFAGHGRLVLSVCRWMLYLS